MFLLYDYMKWNKKQEILVMKFLNIQKAFVHAAQYILFKNKHKQGIGYYMQ